MVLDEVGELAVGAIERLQVCKVNALGAANDDAAGVEDAVGYIAELRQASDLAKLPVGRRVVVMTDGRGHNYGSAFPGAEIATVPAATFAGRPINDIRS